MAHGLKYTVSFSEYTLKISQKDYAGSNTSALAGSPAVLHAWDKDDPTAPVKGSSLTANVVGLPLLDLYANNDDEFFGELYHDTELLFAGFLVQDDCIEDVDDLAHSSSLSFTDNLGLLKDVSFGDALAIRQTGETGLGEVTTQDNDAFLPMIKTLQPGDTFTIYEDATNWGTFTVATIVDATIGTYTTIETLPILADVIYNVVYHTIFTGSKVPLFIIIQACLRATGVVIPLTVFANLLEDRQSGEKSFFYETLIAKESFLKSEKEYESCYTVLEMIMERFQCQLLQRKGEWVVKRCFETVPAGYKFNTDFVFTGTDTYSETATSGFNQPLYPEYGYNKRILRPYNAAKETFEYQQPQNLLKNASFENLGDLIRSYNLSLDVDIATTSPHSIFISYRRVVPVNTGDTFTITGTPFDGTYTVNASNNTSAGLEIAIAETVTPHGPDAGTVVFNDVTVEEYEMPYWTSNNIGGPNEIYIRLIKDSVEQESERYGVVERNSTGLSDFIAAFATPIDIDKDDIIELSFQFRTSVNHAQPSPDISFGAILTEGYFTTPSDNDLELSTPSPHKSLEWNGAWNGPTGYGGSDGTNNPWVGVDTSDWQSVSIRSRRAPSDGVLYIFLADLADSLFLASGEETHYKDFRFSLIYAINDSINVTGQTHVNTQNINIKNKSEESIGLDDSPRRSIKGTLFLPQVDNNFNTKTKVWNTGKRLGEITTKELKQWRSRARTILEGNLYADLQTDIHVSPLTTFTNPAFPDLNFVPGKMEIDYANKRFSCTLHELYETGEADVTSTYAFEYTYNTK